MEEICPKVSIIILNYNSGNFLLDCINSIQNCNYTNYEIILVDNGSNDNSHTKCKEKFSGVKLIENKENLGYCEGNNVGIKQSTGKFIVILNPDTKVTPDWLNQLLKAYEDHGEGLYQPKLLFLNERSKINSAGNMIQAFGFGYSRGHGEIDRGQYDSFQKIGFASGACLFTEKKIFDKIGYFEPFLFAYNEDMEFGWRAAKKKINSYYVPQSIVYHYGSLSHQWAPNKFFLLERNRLYCIKTHYSVNTQKKIKPYFWFIEFLLFFYFLSKGMVSQKFKTYSSIKQNKEIIEKKHQEFEKSRQISDMEILKNFVDEIFVPSQVSGKISNKIFNHLLGWQSRAFKNKMTKN